MPVPQDTSTFEARLASFDATTTKKKRVSRASTTKGSKSKALKWPHKQPEPLELAQAGFYYNPSASSPDNTTCFVCLENLDGWEEEDDPLEQHLQFSPDCGWALQLSIERSIEQGKEIKEDPMSNRMLDARTTTFSDRWPHEKKRNWVCKTRRMAEAGWYYCPTPDSDDFVRCAYCNLGLDGWEPKDNPLEEHQRRSSECTFFRLAPIAQTKKGRASTKRASSSMQGSEPALKRRRTNSRAARSSVMTVASPAPNHTIEVQVPREEHAVRKERTSIINDVVEVVSPQAREVMSLQSLAQPEEAESDHYEEAHSDIQVSQLDPRETVNRPTITVSQLEVEQELEPQLEVEAQPDPEREPELEQEAEAEPELESQAEPELRHQPGVEPLHRPTSETEQEQALQTQSRLEVVVESLPRSHKEELVEKTDVKAASSQDSESSTFSDSPGGPATPPSPEKPPATSTHNQVLSQGPITPQKSPERTVFNIEQTESGPWSEARLEELIRGMLGNSSPGLLQGLTEEMKDLSIEQFIQVYAKKAETWYMGKCGGSITQMEQRGTAAREEILRLG